MDSTILYNISFQGTRENFSRKKKPLHQPSIKSLIFTLGYVSFSFNAHLPGLEKRMI